MQIQVKAKGLPRAAMLRQLVAEKLNRALEKFTQFIEAVVVRLEDINGPQRGGVDKLCRIVINFKHSAVMVVEELGKDMEQVIAWVMERLPDSVARQLAGRGAAPAS